MEQSNSFTITESALSALRFVAACQADECIVRVPNKDILAENPYYDITLHNLQSTRWTLRRMWFARIVDTVATWRPVNGTSFSPGVYDALNSTEFVVTCLRMRDEELLRVCDEASKAIIDAWAGRGYRFSSSLSMEDHSDDQVTFYRHVVDCALSQWNSQHDYGAILHGRAMYCIAAFLLRTELVAPTEDFSGLVGRNAGCKRQRSPSYRLRRIFQSLAGPSFERTAIDNFSPRHGDGAVSWRTKVSDTWTVVHKRCSKAAKDELLSSSKWLRAFITRYNYAFSFDLSACVGYVSPYILSPGSGYEGIPMQITTVPKTWKTRRVIGAEDCARMWVQQGLRIGLQSAIDRSQFSEHINLEDSRLNTEMAQIGSITNGLFDDQFATIDLSAASDTLSVTFVESLFSGMPELWAMLRDARPRSFQLPGGEVYELNIFGLMGNAYTFPVQTMVFTAILAEARDLLPHVVAHFKVRRRPLPDALSGCEDEDKLNAVLRAPYRVYGDDMVAHRAVAHVAVWLLKVYGFDVNAAKTFTSGSYRESCGGEFVEGYDVTPLKLPRAFLSINDVTTKVDKATVVRLRWTNDNKAEYLHGVNSLLERCDPYWSRAASGGNPPENAYPSPSVFAFLIGLSCRMKLMPKYLAENIDRLVSWLVDLKGNLEVANLAFPKRWQRLAEPLQRLRPLAHFAVLPLREGAGLDVGDSWVDDLSKVKYRVFSQNGTLYLSATFPRPVHYVRETCIRYDDVRVVDLACTAPDKAHRQGPFPYQEWWSQPTGEHSKNVERLSVPKIYDTTRVVSYEIVDACLLLAPPTNADRKTCERYAHMLVSPTPKDESMSKKTKTQGNQRPKSAPPLKKDAGKAPSKSKTVGSKSARGASPKNGPSKKRVQTGKRP